MNKEFIELVKSNPDLPVFAWVNSEIVADSYGYWLGQFNNAYIKEYAKVEPYDYMDRDYIFKDDYEDYLEYLLNKDLELSEEEALKIINNLDYKKAIFVYVDLPNKF